MQKRIFIVVVGIFVLYLVGAYFTQEVVWRGAPGQKFRGKLLVLKDQLRSYQATQVQFAESDFFIPSTKQGDAGPFLNPKLRWLNAESVYAYVEGYPPSPAQIPAWALKGAAALKWETYKNPALNQVKFEWWKELQKFDHWELIDKQRLEKAFESIDKGLRARLIFQNANLPNLEDLFILSRIRLLQGLKQNQVLPALKEVRHLAKLLYSTETHAGAMGAAKILEIESDAFSFAVSKKLIQKTAWKPLTTDFTELRKRLANTFAFYTIASTPELLNETVGNPKNVVGRCVAINQSLDMLVQALPYLRGQVPLEVNLSPQIEALKAIALDEKNGCRILKARALWKDLPRFAKREPISGSTYKWIAYSFPYLRRAEAIEILSSTN